MTSARDGSFFANAPPARPAPARGAAISEDNRSGFSRVTGIHDKEHQWRLRAHSSQRRNRAAASSHPRSLCPHTRPADAARARGSCRRDGRLISDLPNSPVARIPHPSAPGGHSRHFRHNPAPYRPATQRVRQQPVLSDDRQRARMASIAAVTSSISAMPSTFATMPRAS